MVRFIVPLQSPQVSGNWKHVSLLCNATLKSILAQTDNRFEVTLVCNELPLDFQSHPQLKVIKTDLPAPLEKGRARMMDKWKKVRLALEQYYNSSDAYYMIVDADDRLSNRLVEFVLKGEFQPGWIFDQGLVYDCGYPWLYKRNDFSLICGSSSIIFCPSSSLPSGPEDNKECFLLEYGHSTIKGYFEKVGSPLRSLPFAGAVYMLNTGENDSGEFYLGVNSIREKIRRLLSLRLFTRQIKREFFLWDI